MLRLFILFNCYASFTYNPKYQYLLGNHKIIYVGRFNFFCMNFKLQFIHIILSLYQRISYGKAGGAQKKAKTR